MSCVREYMLGRLETYVRLHSWVSVDLSPVKGVSNQQHGCGRRAVVSNRSVAQLYNSSILANDIQWKYMR